MRYFTLPSRESSLNMLPKLTMSALSPSENIPPCMKAKAVTENRDRGTAGDSSPPTCRRIFALKTSSTLPSSGSWTDATTPIQCIIHSSTIPAVTQGLGHHKHAHKRKGKRKENKPALEFTAVSWPPSDIINHLSEVMRRFELKESERGGASEPRNSGCFC